VQQFVGNEDYSRKKQEDEDIQRVGPPTDAGRCELERYWMAGDYFEQASQHSDGDEKSERAERGHLDGETAC